MSFDNLLGYILSISMCMQNFITIFHSVQEIAPLPLFQNLELGKASTSEKYHFANSWARSCQYQFTQLFIKIVHSVQEIGPFSLFQNLALGKASNDDKRHFAIPQYQCLRKILSKYSKRFKIKFHCFQNLNLGKISTNPKFHLTTSWATSCQYQSVCKISS